MLEVLGGDDAFEGGHCGFETFCDHGGGVEDGLAEFGFVEEVRDSLEGGAGQLLAVERVAADATHFGENLLADLRVTGFEGDVFVLLLFQFSKLGFTGRGKMVRTGVEVDGKGGGGGADVELQIEEVGTTQDIKGGLEGLAVG